MGTRTNNAVRNISSALIYQIVNIILKFVMRTIFTYSLGIEYLGINGVFSNVLTILSLSELGVGTAIIYSMYKPIADSDTKKVNQLLKYYKKIYTVIGITILVLGSFLLPFLDNIVTDIPNVPYISWIYVLFLIQTSSSYFFAQYSSLFAAYQKGYVCKKVQLYFSVIKAIGESMFLILTKQYILYLLLDIVLSVLTNYCIYRKAIQYFPFIKDKTQALDKEDINVIWKNAVSSFSIKIGTTVINASDNLVISTFISTVLVGLYSNYGLIIQIVLTTTVLIQQAVMAGVGNVCVSGSEKDKTDLFHKLFFLYGGIYALTFAGLLNILQPFVILWLGETYQLETPIVIIAVFNCYLSGMHQPIEAFIYSDGLYKYFKWKPWIEAVINLLVSILLAIKIGMIGVFIGTSISHFCLTFWYDARVVYKYSFSKSTTDYFKRYGIYFMVR